MTFVLLMTEILFLKTSKKFILDLKLDLKTHATFLDLDIGIKDCIFVYKPFDKRDAFSFEIVRMPFICSNIHSGFFLSLFYIF